MARSVWCASNNHNVCNLITCSCYCHKGNQTMKFIVVKQNDYRFTAEYWFDTRRDADDKAIFLKSLNPHEKYFVYKPAGEAKPVSNPQYQINEIITD
jgi:hypothetical protein